MTSLTFEWVHTAEIERDAVPPCRVVEVYTDQYGEHWVGLTHYRDGRDFIFEPREQYGTGDSGLYLSIRRADSWARELAFDATR